MPTDWLPGCEAASLFYSPGTVSQARDTILMPEIANGYLGTIQGSDTIYAGGLFDGDATGKFGPASHRARIPAYRVTLSAGAGRGVDAAGSALDIERAVFLQRSRVGGVAAEERWFAHATRPSLLVHEVELTNGGTASANVTLSASASAPSSELNLTAAAGTAPTDYAVAGQNIVGEDATMAGGGNHTQVAFIANAPCEPGPGGSCSQTVAVPAGQTVTYYFLTTVVTSLNSTAPLRDASDIHRAALAAPTGALLREHEVAWRARWARGSVAVVGDLRLAQAINASLYSLRSSIRDDWPYGLSPGGLTSDGYNGVRDRGRTLLCGW